MDAGVFHDAHEVYFRPDKKADWQWTATFAHKVWADAYAAMLAASGTPLELLEVRPV